MQMHVAHEHDKEYVSRFWRQVSRTRTEAECSSQRHIIVAMSFGWRAKTVKDMFHHADVICVENVYTRPGGCKERDGKYGTGSNGTGSAIPMSGQWDEVGRRKKLAREFR